jgi:hypothetical protein
MGMGDDMIRAGLEALRGGKKREARRIFGDLVREEPDSAAAWWYLAAVLDDSEQKAHCLRQVLRLQPRHEEARRMLAAVQGRIARPTPPRGSPRPIHDARESEEGLIVAAEAEEPVEAEESSGNRDLTVMIAAVVIALVAIVATVVLVTTGLASESLGIRGPDLEPTLRPIIFGVPACAAAGGSRATLVFINNTGVEIDVLEGPQELEEFRATLLPGAQAEVETQPGVPVRFAVRTQAEDYASSGATLKVPAGSTCRVPIGE